MNQTLRYIAHAILGGAMGVFASVVFLIIYTYQQFDMINVPAHVSVNTLRFNSALAMTVFILLVILIISFRRGIVSFLRKIYDTEEEEEDETE
jgi:hypothetical protein